MENKPSNRVLQTRFFMLQQEQNGEPKQTNDRTKTNTHTTRLIYGRTINKEKQNSWLEVPKQTCQLQQLPLKSDYKQRTTNVG